MLVKVAGKRKGVNKYYVGEIMNKYEQEFEVIYIKRIILSYFFIFEEDEIYMADPQDIERKLPKPVVLLGNERTMTKLSFYVNFESYSVF